MPVTQLVEGYALKIMDNNVNTITISENQSLCYLKNSYVVTEMTPLVEAPERDPDPADDWTL